MRLLLVSALGLFFSPVAPASPAAPHRIVVKLRPEARGPQSMEALRSVLGGELVSAGPSRAYLLLSASPHTAAGRRALRALRHRIEFAEPEIPMALARPVDRVRLDFRATGDRIGTAAEGRSPMLGMQLPSVPNDRLFEYQWGMQDSGYGLRLPTARSYTLGSGITVAVVDTGVRNDLSDFAGTSFLPAWDATTQQPGGVDRNGHGTHACGTIAQATNNGIGCAGVAPGVRLLPVKALGDNGQGSNFSVAVGIRYAVDQGAQVINLSVGGSPSEVVRDACRYAAARGVVVVCASGNSGKKGLAYPARYPETIAVGAVGTDGFRAPFSQYGPELSLVAPGARILQQTIRQGGGSSGYYYFSGTSMAAPAVAGAAALLKSLDPSLSPTEVRDLLCRSAQDRGLPGRDDQHGAGLLDAGAACRLAVAGRASPGGAPPPSNPPPPPSNPPPAAADPGPVNALAAEVLRLFNVERAKENLAPLSLEARLITAATRHAEDMAARGVMSHTGGDGSNPGERLSRVGYPWRTYGECVARGQPTPEAVVAAWMASPGHRAIIMGGQFAETGVARSGAFWCATFGRR